MNSERPYRIAVGLLLVAGMGTGLRFRRRAARSGENLWEQRVQEGPVLLAMRAIAGLVLFGAVPAFLIRPSLLDWSRFPAPAWLRWSAIGVGALSVPLLGWTMSNLGENLTDTIAIRRKHRLVTSGPYRWVRHPFYTVTSLNLLALCVALRSWFLGLGLLLFWVYLWRRTPLEEAKLLEHFGAEYRAYQARTGRLLPRLTRTTGP
jgi:protein-S-isoprenylcysteine O-methyltransferase Ste14